MLSRSAKKELAAEVALFAAGVAALSLLWTAPLLLAALLLAGFAAFMSIWGRRDDLLFFLVGAFLGPVAEVAAVSAGAWQYASPTVLGIPLWLPVGWGIACVSVRRVAGTLTGKDR